jgi:hypothetical protein
VLLSEQDRCSCYPSASAHLPLTVCRPTASPSLQQLLAETKFELVEHTLKFDYDYWGAGELGLASSPLQLADPHPRLDEILQAVLPEDLLDESPTAFTLVGHVGELSRTFAISCTDADLTHSTSQPP